MSQGLGPAAERLNKKGENRGLREAEYIPQSIVAVTEEVLVKEIIEFKVFLMNILRGSLMRMLMNTRLLLGKDVIKMVNIQRYPLIY